MVVRSIECVYNFECDFLLPGCPVKFPRMDVINDKLESLSSKERHILCDCLFLAINWFREVYQFFEWLYDCINYCADSIQALQEDW